MQTLELKAAHMPVQNYPAALRQSEELGVQLIGQVITVSLETVKIVKNLPRLEAEQHGKGM